MGRNLRDRDKWSPGDAIDIRRQLSACAGYVGTPGWTVMRSEILSSYSGFSDLNVVELGCGHGKMSLVFSLLGAQASLLDYNEDQLHVAGTLHRFFGLNPELIHGDILNVDATMNGVYDISMSFGTAEHFWGDERQAVFNAHASVLRKGGLAMIWVPNRFGVLFHLRRSVRILLGRHPATVDETPFTRRELYDRATQAGLKNIRTIGAEQLQYDFHHFIFKLPYLSRRSYAPFELEPDAIKKDLIHMAMSNNAKVRFAGNYFSYSLLLMGYKQ